MKVFATVRYGPSQITQVWELEHLNGQPHLVFVVLRNEDMLLIKLHPDQLTAQSIPEDSEQVFDYGGWIEPDTHQSRIVPKGTEFDTPE